MSRGHSGARHVAVLEAVRELSAASDLLDASVAERLNIHRTDLRCIDYLARFGPMPAGRLAEAVGLTAGALTVAVDRLEAAGYARRRNDPDDRRRVVVQLTRKADRVTALFAGVGLSTDRLADSFSDAELQVITRFVRAASEQLANQAQRVSGRRHDRPTANTR